MRQFPVRARPRWGLVLAGVALLLLVLLIAPQLYLLKMMPAWLLLAVGAMGYFVRRRFLDAALFLGAHVGAAFFGEPAVGPLALAVLVLGLLAVSGRPLFSVLAGGALFGLFLQSVELKQRFAGSVLTWQDVRYFFLQFSDNVGVFTSQPTLLMYAGIALLVSTGVAVGVWRMDRPAIAGHSHTPRHHRALARGLACGIALWCGYELEEASRVESLTNPWHFSASVTHTPVSTFLSTLHIQPKAAYHKVDTRQFAQEVRALSPGPGASPTPADIVLFLQESQFNPAAISGCPPALCQSGLFEARAETTDDGELRVHIQGGGTWLSEFALETGLPHSIFGRAGEFAPFNIAPDVNRSFVRSLKSAGYHTVAIYPVRGGMMNARKAYEGYGFDEFLDASDLGIPGTYDTPDAVIHEAAVKALHAARQHGKPVFLMAVTIFNHGEHGVEMQRVPAPIRDAAQATAGPDSEKANLADYVWRTREFEAAYNQTRDAVLGSSRPAVLAWFGDHQPPFGSAPGLRDRIRASVTKPAVPDRYVTWYNISTNRSPAPTAGKRHRIDIAFLPGLLAQRAGVPLDDWLAANVLVRERCAGLLIECADASTRSAYLSYLFDDLHAFR
ncbi:MAG: sulfatase-like hydrolase/transferase [Ramlibacter sp.]|nr:sulfatase-like hydrolase/transferase [Ramlibacter sp.]